MMIMCLAKGLQDDYETSKLHANDKVVQLVSD